MMKSMYARLQATAKNFGTAHAGPNYGIVFTATIASGLVGSFVLQVRVCVCLSRRTRSSTSKPLCQLG
jgi:hypothetical protein